MRLCQKTSHPEWRGNSDWLWLILALATSLLFALGAGYFWSTFPYSSQEALANFAKADDWFRSGLFSVWSDSYLGGTPLAFQWGSLLSSAWIWAWTKIFGLALGPKLALLICVPFSALTCWIFVRRLTHSARTACLAAIFYALSPALWIRIVMVEHAVVVCAMAVFPLVAWSVLRLVEHPSVLSALLVAATAGMLSVTYSKAAVLAVPILAGLLFWGLWRRCGAEALIRPPVILTLIGGLLLLAVLPNLPALRESQWAVMFRLAPLEGWQQAFSTKSLLQSADRLGQPLGAFLPGFAASTARGSYYPGLAVLVGLVLATIWQWKIFDRRERGLFRLSLGLALMALWFSYGPFSVFSGALDAARASVPAADFFPALIWLSVFLQGLLIWFLLPRRMPLRRHGAALLIAIYLFVPGFQVLSLVPLYGQIRAPFDFYQVTGTLWVMAAGALAIAALLRALSGWKLKGLAVIGLAAAVSFDFLGPLGLVREKALAAGTFAHFQQSADFLKTSTKEGRILPISGRYFFLLLPGLTDRPIVQEAFQMYYQGHDYAALQAAATSSLPNYLQYLRVAGVRYVWVDRNDPDLPAEFVQRLSEFLSPAFENDDFLVLEVTDTFPDGFQGVPGPDMASAAGLPNALEALDDDKIIALGATPSASNSNPTNAATPEPSASHRAILPLRPEKPAATRIIISGLTAERAVLPIAWHPDWVTSDAQPTLRALGGLLGLEPATDSVEVWLRPPWWYRPVWVLFLSASVVALLLLIGVVCSSRWRRLLDRRALPEPLRIERPPVVHAVVVIPTYNEVDSLHRVLDLLRTSAEAVDILVVDDASPDGTAESVKRHAEFGRNIFLIERTGKLGLGSAYREGFRWAAEHGYDGCLEMDADLSHDPADVPRLVGKLNEGFDVVIGSRYLDGLRVVNWPEHRLLISAFGTQFVRVLTGLPLSDATSGFKAIRVSALGFVDEGSLRANGYGFQVELHHALWLIGARLVEIPITFTERREGKTKMSPAIAFEAMKRVISLALTPWGVREGPGR